jgi:hypothetical protein
VNCHHEEDSLVQVLGIPLADTAVNLEIVPLGIALCKIYVPIRVMKNHEHDSDE